MRGYWIGLRSGGGRFSRGVNGYSSGLVGGQVNMGLVLRLNQSVLT